MPENDSSKVTPNEQDPYSLPVLSEIAGRALLPESEKEFYAAWEAEAEIFGTIKVFFAHGEDPAALIRLLADSEDYVAEVTIRVRDRETAEGKRKALDLAGFSVWEGPGFIDCQAGFWRRDEVVPAHGVHACVVGMVSEFEKEDSFPVDLIPLMIDRYLTPHSTAPVDRGTVERLLVEVWENIPDGHRHTAVVRLMIGMGYLPVWPHLDEWGDAAMARGDVLDPGNLGEILNRLQLA